MRTTRLQFPGLPPLTLYVRAARKGCEHFCFIGAVMDATCYAIKIEAFTVVLLGKVAFAAGAVGIYLLHLEETAHQRSTPQPPEGANLNEPA